MVRHVVDVIGTSWRAVWAKPMRSLLMSVGTAIGVGIVVGSQGVLLSGTAGIRMQLEELGTNLVVVDASANGMSPQAAQRAISLEGVDEAATAALIAEAPAVSPRVQHPPLDAISTAVWSVSDNLLDVLHSEMRAGRSLNAADVSARLPTAVVGAKLADQLMLDGEGLRTMWLGGHQVAIVGILRPVALAPEFDTAVLVPPTTASDLFGASNRPTRVFARTTNALVEEVATVLPIVISQGEGDTPTVRIASDLLEASAAIDEGLQELYFSIGGLALFVGTFGIYNTLQLTMQQRRQEIGVRRALGHSRTAVGGQFVVEAVVISAVGAVIGLVGGVAFATVVARRRGWPTDIDFDIAALAVGGGVALASFAGGVIALRVARLSPTVALSN